MPLPTLFAGLTAATGLELDINFSVVGLLGALPCTASGTNTIALTGAANNPSIVAYSNYLQFSFIASATNNGAVTIAYGALPALSAYVDSAGGPIGLTGSEIILNNQYVAVYDSTLNSGAGGFHLRGVPSASGAPINPTKLQVNGGATVTRLLSTLATVTFSVVTAQSSQDQNVSLTGASIGDCIILGPPSVVQPSVSYVAFVPAAGTVTLRAINCGSASITPTGGLYRLTDVGFT